MTSFSQPASNVHEYLWGLMTGNQYLRDGRATQVRTIVLWDRIKVVAVDLLGDEVLLANCETGAWR